MAIRSWILGGIVVSDHITEVRNSCWKRPDLMQIPEILLYEHTHLKKERIHIFENNVGVLIMLIPYDSFTSQTAMEDDYYGDSSKSKYAICYREAIAALKKHTLHNFADFDWVMPIMEGSTEINQNYCKISGIDGENKDFVSLIDCSMVYSSVKLVSDFMHTICNVKSLTKYQRWQLAYYQRIIQTIEKPNVFLTNKEEIGYYEQYYSLWGINDSIKLVLSNAGQTISLFSFISNYENNEDNDLFSSFLTFFGIIVGLEAIYNLLTALFTKLGQVFNIAFIILIAISIVSFGVIFAKKAVRRYIEKREFKQKTKKR